jgi:hypothetical protein
MAPKQEILPPSRSQVPARRENSEIAAAPSRIKPGGAVSSTLMRWAAERDARTFTAVAARTRAESDLFEAQHQAMESFIKRQRVLGHVQELSEIIATDRAQRRAERAEDLRDSRNRHEIAETRRMTERALVERDLVDAQQALTAQRDHGYSSYELEWKKRTCEMLDVELSAAERRAILRQHLAELDQAEPSGAHCGSDAAPTDAALDDTLYEVRAQLLANGLDTTGIDALIQRRKTKP